MTKFTIKNPNYDGLVETLTIRTDDGEWHTYELLPDTEIEMLDNEAIAAFTMKLNIGTIVEIIAN